MAERTGLPKDEVYKKVSTADLTSLNVSEDNAKVVFQVVEERIKVKIVKAWGVLDVRCPPQTVLDVFKKPSKTLKKLIDEKDLEVIFSVIATLKYRSEVMADNWKHTEDVLNKANERALANIVNLCSFDTSKRIIAIIR